MLSMTFAFVVITAFLLAFATFRWIGLLGLAVLFYLFPLASVALLILAGGAFYLMQHR